MASAVIDTSVLISLERRRGDAFREFLLAEPDPAISTITIAELLVGAFNPKVKESSRTRTLRFTKLLMRKMRKLPLDVRVARVHAELWVALGNRIQEVDPNDLIIAATALARNRSVLTEEKGSFDVIAAVSDLEVRHFPT